MLKEVFERYLQTLLENYLYNILAFQITIFLDAAGYAQTAKNRA